MFMDATSPLRSKKKIWACLASARDEFPVEFIRSKSWNTEALMRKISFSAIFAQREFTERFDSSAVRLTSRPEK